MIRVLALAGALLFFSTPAAFAAGAEVLITGEVQLRVADSFMEEKEYYRAITEYKRFLFLFPDSTECDYALFQTGMAYLSGGDNNGAVKNLEALRERYPVSPHGDGALFFTGMAHWKAKRTQEACSTFLAVVRVYPDSLYSPQALAAGALTQLDDDNPQASHDLLERFVNEYPGHRETGNVRKAMTLIDDYSGLPQKSEALAGILSAIVPGAGYAYAGDYGTAVMSFVVNGAFIAGAWTAFAQGLYGVGVLAGGVGAPFYIGNIYGSALAAKKANRAARQEMANRVHSTLGFVFERKPLR